METADGENRYNSGKQVMVRHRLDAKSERLHILSMAEYFVRSKCENSESR